MSSTSICRIGGRMSSTILSAGHSQGTDQAARRQVAEFTQRAETVQERAFSRVLRRRKAAIRRLSDRPSGWNRSWSHVLRLCWGSTAATTADHLCVRSTLVGVKHENEMLPRQRRAATPWSKRRTGFRLCLPLFLLASPGRDLACKWRCPAGHFSFGEKRDDPFAQGANAPIRLALNPSRERRERLGADNTDPPSIMPPTAIFHGGSARTRAL